MQVQLSTFAYSIRKPRHPFDRASRLWRADRDRIHRGFGAQIRQTFRLRLAEVCSLAPCSHGSVGRLLSPVAVPPIFAAVVPPTLEIENAQPCWPLVRVPQLVHSQKTSTLPKSSDRPPKFG